MYNGEDIQENQASRKLNILKGFVETEEFFEKGNFGKNLNKKEDDAEESGVGQFSAQAQPKPQNQEAVNTAEQAVGMKSSEDHAKETESDDLKVYIANNPDGEHVAAAKAELQARGEDVDMNQDVDSDGDGDSEMEGNQEQGEQSGAVDFANPESVSQGILQNKDAIAALMAEDPTLTGAHALKMHLGASGSNSEAHGALDAAQAALDAAKSATGHPGAGEGAGQSTEGLEGAKNWLNEFINSSKDEEIQEEDIINNTPEEYKEFIQQAIAEYDSDDTSEESDESQNQNEFDSDESDDDDEEGTGEKESVDAAENELEQDGGADSDDDDEDEKKKNFGKK